MRTVFVFGQIPEFRMAKFGKNNRPNSGIKQCQIRELNNAKFGKNNRPNSGIKQCQIRELNNAKFGKNIRPNYGIWKKKLIFAPKLNHKI